MVCPRLVPIGDAKSGNHSLRSLSLPLFAHADGGTVTREAGSVITVTLYYRSVESGSLGDIVPLLANEIQICKYARCQGAKSDTSHTRPCEPARACRSCYCRPKDAASCP